VEVLGHHNEVESGALGEDGMLDQDLGLPLFMSTEVGESSHGVVLSFDEPG
jgi:hypothetical protein